MTSLNLPSLFQPSPATPDPPATVFASSPATSSPRRGNAGHRAAKPRATHHNRSSLIQRFGSAEISYTYALWPWAPPVSACAPWRWARLVSLFPLPVADHPGSLVSARPRVRARSRSDLIVAICSRSCGRDLLIPLSRGRFAMKPLRFMRFNPPSLSFTRRSLSFACKPLRFARICIKNPRFIFNHGIKSNLGF